MIKNYFIKVLTIFMLFTFTTPIEAVTLHQKLVIPNTKVLTRSSQSSERLSQRFVKTLMTNLEIQSILQEIAKDQKVELQPFQYDSKRGIKFFNETITEEEKQKIKKLFKKDEIINGYYFYVKYRSSKRDTIINVGLTIGEFILDKGSPTSSVVGGILIPFLKDRVFKVTKYRQLKKFNERYRQINTVMTEILMQTNQIDIQENPTDYGVNKVIIYTEKLIVPKNTQIEIHVKEILLK